MVIRYNRMITHHPFPINIKEKSPTKSVSNKRKTKLLTRENKDFLSSLGFKLLI